MEKLHRITAAIAPLALDNVDTDMIIPAQFLTSISRDGYGENLFCRLRKEDPDFFLSKKQYADAKILVVGENFGCGSSREHAVWAIQEAGFQAVIGKSFADIFTSNAGKNGLLLVSLQTEIVDSLLQNTPPVEVTIDLELQKVILPEGDEISFIYDSFRKHCLLNGIDDLDYIHGYFSEIEQFRSSQEKIRFFRTDQPNHEVS